MLFAVLYISCGLNPLIEMAASSKFNVHPKDTKSLTPRSRATCLPGWSSTWKINVAPAKRPNDSC
eukprot:2397681-Lingulodinium_polyedra.AAC.1